MVPSLQTSRKLSPNKTREHFHKMLSELDPNEFTLFHLTTTYLPYQELNYSESIVNKFFINFYLKSLLPDIFHTRSWSNTKRLKQPLVLSFLDEHEHHPIQTNGDDDHPIYSHPIRLHHHSIIASRNYTIEFFQSQIGTNTFNRYSSKFMTTDLKQCGADRLFYASKMLWKYPNHLVFGTR